MPNSNMESVDAIAEHLVTVSLGVITMRNDGIYTQKQSEELLDKYQANATAALERREERLIDNFKDELADWIRYEATVKTTTGNGIFQSGQYVNILDVFKKIGRQRNE